MISPTCSTFEFGINDNFTRSNNTFENHLYKEGKPKTDRTKPCETPVLMCTYYECKPSYRTYCSPSP